MRRRTSIAAVIAAAGAAVALAQQGSVVSGPHNLSAGGPGSVRAASEDQVCIFCHAPHGAQPTRPLWNRYTPVGPYRIYESRSLDAQPGQPTGASKMCLSCHDGTIALGNVVSRSSPIGMSGALGAMPAGRSNLGTDLSDDHPISFRYDSALAARDPHIKDPALLPREVALDANRELQCTTCHDPHDNSRGMFLVMHNGESELCRTCHQMGETTIREHEGCNACHQPHTAPSGPYLLRRRTITATCLSCHDGSRHDAANIAAEMRKAFAHDTGGHVDPPGAAVEHATCTSCHDPHTMRRGSASPPVVHPNFGEIGGVNVSGAPVRSAGSEYEVCFRCHADGNQVRPTVPRRLSQNNTRLEFAPGAISAHPVVAPGGRSDVPSLLPGWTGGKMVACSDCHGSDNGGLSSPAGVHGSNHAPLLVARYETADFTSESARAYALCYRCHDRGSILNDRSFPLHRKHIVDERAPCAACHDAHGISAAQGTPSGNTHLINFATTMVYPDGATGRLEFRDTGPASGECYLRCHSANHSPARYGR